MADMKDLMKNAWEIAKQLEGDLRAKLSYALKRAWQEAKAENLEMDQDDIEWEAEERLEEVIKGRLYTYHLDMSKQQGITITFKSFTYGKGGAVVGMIDLYKDGRVEVSKDRYGVLRDFASKKVVDVETYAEEQARKAADKEANEMNVLIQEGFGDGIAI